MASTIGMTDSTTSWTAWMELGLAGVLGHQLFHERTDCINDLRHGCYTLLELDLWGAGGAAHRLPAIRLAQVSKHLFYATCNRPQPPYWKY